MKNSKKRIISVSYTHLGYTPENIRVRRETLGGSVYDLGCYCTSLMLTLFGEEPKEVRAIGLSLIHI